MPSADAVLELPQTTIGAQDLLNVGKCSKSGFLRKEGSLERFFKFLRWRQKFVVLSRGCIYIFKNEYSSSPQLSHSLKVFSRCCRNEGRMRWIFQVLPADDNARCVLCFACLSDQERKDWMKSIKEEMIKAHKVTEQQLDAKGEDKTDYVYLEKPVPTGRRPAPSINDDEDDDDDDLGGEKDYTTIDDALISDRPPVSSSSNGTKVKFDPKPKPKPALKEPSPNKTMPAGQASRKPVPSPEPARASTLPANPAAVKRTAFEFNGSDREEIESILVARPEGTYLVRKSRQDKKEVLSVNVDGMLKEFKIYEKNSRYTIDNTEYFDSVEDLIQNYVDKPLPKKATKLYRAYSVIDPRYIN